MRKFAVQKKSNKQYEAHIRVDSSVHIYVIEFAVHKIELQASIRDLGNCCKTVMQKRKMRFHMKRNCSAESRIPVG